MGGVLDVKGLHVKKHPSFEVFRFFNGFPTHFHSSTTKKNEKASELLNQGWDCCSLFALYSETQEKLRHKKPPRGSHKVCGSSKGGVS